MKIGLLTRADAGEPDREDIGEVCRLGVRTCVSKRGE